MTVNENPNKMTVDKLIEMCQQAADDKVIKALLEEHCEKFDVRYPSLDPKTLRPYPVAATPVHDCTGDGKCNNCDRFICSEDDGPGEIFAYKIFTGYCLKKNED